MAKFFPLNSGQHASGLVFDASQFPRSRTRQTSQDPTPGPTRSCAVVA